MDTAINNSDRLQQMLKEVFITEDERTFLTHFNLYLEHGNDPNKHVVDFDLVWEWMGFSRKDNAKRTLMKFFEINADYIIESSPRPNEEQSQSRRGGHNKETIMLSVNTFKSLCMLSNTAKGKQSRLYYIRMEQALFKFLDDERTQQVTTLKSALKRDKERDHQKTLITHNHMKQCVYVFRVSDIDEDGSYLVKFGKTCDIKTRTSFLAKDFDVCVLLEVIQTPNEHRLEQHVFHRPTIRRRRIANTEVIQLDNNFTVEDFVKLIRDSARSIEESNMNISQIIIKRIRDNIHDEVDEATKAYFIEKIANPELDYVGDPEVQRFHTVYKYDPKDLTNPIESFESLRDAVRSIKNIDSRFRDYHVRDAATASTLLAGFRWYYIDETAENPRMTPPRPIPPTHVVPEKKKASSLVAQISADKTKVLKVYDSVNSAAKAVETSACNVTLAKQNGKKAKGFHWAMWDELGQALKDTYTEALPQALQSKRCSKRIQQKDPVTYEVIEEFACIQDIVTKHKICHKKINELCKSGAMYKGFVWSLIH